MTPASLRVFGIGLSKTGTASLAQALRILGYDAIHACTLSDIHNHKAATDTPVTARFQELDKLYPNSKFIMTIRDTREWLKSCKQHFGDGSDLQRYKKEMAIEYAFCRGKLYGSLEFNKEAWLIAYSKHLSLVFDHFATRSDDILWMDITHGDGWQMLCSFLDKPIPQQIFPHLNKSS